MTSREKARLRVYEKTYISVYSIFCPDRKLYNKIIYNTLDFKLFSISLELKILLKKMISFIIKGFTRR